MSCSTSSNVIPLGFRAGTAMTHLSVPHRCGRVLLQWLLLLWVGTGAGFLLAAEAATPSKYNVLFLFSDDHRADAIGALGNRDVRTPNLDRLAREGTCFRRAYIMGGMQGAVCVPSRAMMLSGRPLFHVPENLAGTTTWPMVLRQAGYSAWATGKWHNGVDACLASFPDARTIFLGGMNDHFGVPVQDCGPDGKMIHRRTNSVHSSELFAGQAIEFLENRPKNRPFALYVAFTAPHDPRQAPEEFRRLYDPEKLALPKNFLPEHPFDNGEMKVRDEQLEKWPRTPAAVRGHLADYYAMITHLDSQIGRILQTLRQTGEYERTIIVFAGDNGLAIGSHGLMGKQNLYEHSVRVPLIIAGPGIPKNRRTDAMCYLFDLFPTLCDLNGLPTPPSVEGESLVPVLRRETPRHRGEIFSAYRQVQRAVRDERWKLIEYPSAGRVQLFDLKRDPFEQNDLASKPEFSSRVETMRMKLRLAQTRFDDPLVSVPSR